MTLRLPRNAQLWLPGLVAGSMSRRRTDQRRHVLFAIADHYEPYNGAVDNAVADARVRAWVERYPSLTNDLSDDDGRRPQHTFFYPIEQYQGHHADALAGLVADGHGEVEVHLHHDHDTSDNLRRTLDSFKNQLYAKHGLLTRNSDGSIAYAFIHGNWALDNARPDGRFCGVNDEITILRETGCYADFTMPAAPDPSQTRTVNSIYYAIDDPQSPKSHDRGPRVAVRRRAPGGALLMIQGPLSVNWSRRKLLVLPTLDVGAIDGSAGFTPTLKRFLRWIDVGVTVEGRPEWVFVKIHTHGAPERNAGVLLGPQMHAFHQAILDGQTRLNYVVHYVTAREMANIVAAAEAGESGNPSSFRDYRWPPPECRARAM
jgi:hypothetical protein